MLSGKLSRTIIILFMVFLLGCSKENTNKIRVAGSTTVLPVLVKISDLYMQKNPEIKITINPGGSGVGVTSVATQLIDIGMISRHISGKEREKFKDTTLNVINIGKDAVACAISSEIYDSGIKSLSKKEIRDIYLGKITNWKQLGGPDREILVIDKEHHRGTRHVFMNFLFGDANAKAPGADIVTGSNNEEQRKIAQSNSAIGMLSFAWLDENVKGIGIEDNGKILLPVNENILNNSYPISRDLSIVINGAPTPTIKKFLSFILGSVGQRVIEESHYIGIR